MSTENPSTDPPWKKAVRALIVDPLIENGLKILLVVFLPVLIGVLIFKGKEVKCAPPEKGTPRYERYRFFKKFDPLFGAGGMIMLSLMTGVFGFFAFFERSPKPWYFRGMLVYAALCSFLFCFCFFPMFWRDIRGRKEE
ncbi:MAG: hypothetical protein ACYTFG_01600 [Planctomycetota bacterium]|jgi:hypothetical protein